MALIEVSSMRKQSFWLLVVWTGLAIAGQLAAHGSSDTALVQRTGTGITIKATVGFELYRDYLIVVRGSAGPLKGLNFLLDTGASPSVLDPQLIARLHLAAVPQEIAVLNGSVQGATATVPSLQFGPIRRDNLPVLVEDLSFLQKALPLRIDGIVGLDVLGQSTLVIDYPSREIRFGPLPSLPAWMPLERREGLAVVAAVVDRAPVRLLLDTGASSLILFDQIPEPAPSPKQGEPHPSSKSIGDFERKQKQSINLKLGETEFGHKSAYLVHNRKDAGHDFDGLMSPAALGITRVAIDLNQSRIAFTREP